ncbi:hypothetical protein [Vibrio hepatarius]|uniref:hypothetical protein n=1 Tax=Vibrio hepatarius TaxID=171383 RepID=UPI001C0982FD|nr:hypothetical protein [Vibrio hepatarius]MBU2896123.1 hypothetical protein [Vibrio hepatarius]
MQLICKFVPGNSLSRDVLDFILSPDECIGQLSRTRNLQDVVRQLPKPLAESIPQSAKKDIHRLLTTLKQRLVRADWVAVSSFARRTPLSDTQLQAYPALKARIDTLAAQPEKKVVKANYAMVTDDVPLARNLTFTPVEPAPDKKIVVEFAGQWPGNAAYLTLSSTEEQKEKLAKPRKDMNKHHRSVSVFKSLKQEPRNLYLTIPLIGSTTPLKLLLAEKIAPVDENHEMEEWETLLVPVRPLAYLDENQNKDKATELCGGFIYVFWKGKLWREMAITEKGYYQDIDVEYYRNLYQQEQSQPQPKIIERVAEGAVMPQFWVPYKVAGEVQQGETGLKIMFSPKQKRFNQIESLESDPALLDKSSTPLDELSHYSEQQAFAAQEFTSDVASAKVHQTSEDDMPWLTDQQVVLRSYDQSNTVIAYVDGKNNGFVLRLDVDEEEGASDLQQHKGLTAVMEDADSDWVAIEPFTTRVKDGFISARITGIPPKGTFSLTFMHPEGQDSAVKIFAGLSYQEVLGEKTQAQPAEPHQPTQLDETAAQQRQAESELLDAMNNLIFG